jgi:hypothetical protein
MVGTTAPITPTTTGNAGIPIPIPDTFDFAGWMKPPTTKDPAGIPLRIRNRENCLIEAHNDESIFDTMRCRDDRTVFPT